VDWDRERYRRDVLDPARRSGNVPPPDLYVRYGLPPGVTDPALFAGHVDMVLGYWRELANNRTYAPLARALITAHGTLERSGRLTLRRFAERQAHARQETMERLRRLAETEAGAATHAGQATVTRLRDAAGGGVSDAEVAGALRTAGVRVVRQFPSLPPAPHPKQADLARYLKNLGRSLSAEVVFGDAVSGGFRILDGFRLADGRSLDEETIAAARDRVGALPYTDPAKAPSENVLAILRAAARQPGELDALLLSEVAEPLRQLARAGFLQRGIASQAAELGLDEDEAGLIAAAVLAPDTLEALRQQVTNELAAGRLRGAQQLAGGLPATDPLHERLAALDAEVSELSRRAEAAGPEQAARLLAEAVNLARDDTSLSGQLAALPPPPPRQATARLDRDRVVVTWMPSPDGGVQYRVMRGQDLAPASPDEGTAVVTQTGQYRAEDTGAPPGAELFYSVFASRGGQAWSPPAVTPPTMFTPDVTDVSVLTAETSVAVTWQPPAGADHVLVIRDQDRAPQGLDDGTSVEAVLTGFTDTGLRTGTEYYYRIVTAYRTPGGQRLSGGVVERAVAEPTPEAVADLEITGPADGIFVARWTPPPYGQVRLALGGKPPPWTAGTQLRPGETARLRIISRMPRRGPGDREALELRLPPGRHYLLPLTMGRNVSVVGEATEVRLAEPVRDLSARRMHDDVRLGWVWPAGATDALVRWPGGEHRCSRRVYHDEGGVLIAAGPAEMAIEVRALYPQPGGRLSSPGAQIRVPARGVAVHYRIRRASRWHPQQRIIELSAERETQLPALVVVQSTGPYAPDDPADGETLRRAGPQPIAPGQPVTIAVEVTARPVWLACFADPVPDDHAADGHHGEAGILLFPPPAAEMRIR
jgi:hypothetical protein